MIQDSLYNTINTKKQKNKRDSIVPNIWYPNKAYGFESVPDYQNILFKNATVWTNEAEGIVENYDVIISNGKIIATGNLLNPADYFNNLAYEVVDATDLHLTSGIIDEHSHIAISKGVNEGSQSVTAEVSLSLIHI